MSYKVQVVVPQIGVNANVRYENLDKKDKDAFSVVAKNSKGEVCSEKYLVNGSVPSTGELSRGYVSPDGNVYTKNEMTFWLGDDQVQEKAQTKVLTIDGFQPLANYTDRYIVSTFYEVFPDDNGVKKATDKEMACRGNLAQMKKLHKHLTDEQVVARGEFCPSSRGFKFSDAYIRAINLDGKWGLEIGVFQAEKVFGHLNDEQEIILNPVPTTNKIKLKRV